jgi:hydroxymethylpyrimidine/phosphomethylpyrimidine kinase
MSMQSIATPRALTIAGSDSGGGAGIQADLKTFTALSVYGMSAITSVTAQNTESVRGVHDLPATFVAEQIDAVAQDIGTDAAKTGMLSNAAIVEAVADAVARNGIERLVVDPVMVAKSGDALLSDPAREALVTHLLPRALVVTPNLPEAAALSGMAVDSDAAVDDAVRRIADMGPAFVLLKGGHAPGGECVDYLFDGEACEPFRAPRVDTRNTHGTGCTLSAAIAAHLAKGAGVRVAVAAAKDYLTECIRRSMLLGRGHGPLNHYWTVER